MSGFRKFIPLALAFAALSLFLAGNAGAGDFANARLYIDTNVASTETSAATAKNDSVATVKLPVSGAKITMQLFVPAAAGKKTFGYNLKFVNTGNVFTDNFSAAGTTLSGGSLLGTGAEFSALEIAQPTVGTNGYIGTVELTAKKNVAEGVTVEFDATATTMADAAGANDALVLTKAKLTFQAGPKAAASVDVSKPLSLPVNSSTSVVVTASGFTTGASITWTMTKTSGTATVTKTDAADKLSTTVKATGPGSAVVSVYAKAGTDSTSAVTITFSQQEAAELATFDGSVKDDRVMLSWSTASQTNNAGWRLLRSVDGVNFQAVGEFVSGAGTTDALLSYTAEDRNLPAAEKVYYQLEQVDLDGSITRSNAIEVVLGARLPMPTEFVSNVFPNPFNPSTTISYELPAEAYVSVVVYDAIGQEVRRLVGEQTAAGRYRVQWDAKDSSGRSVGSGVYIAKIEAGSFSSSHKMLLLK